MENSERLAQIERLTLNARTTWFGLLALLVFVGVTLMGHEDADFFAFGAATSLPVIDVAVPTTAFFYVAPILTAALFCYLHIFLIGLWEELGRIEQGDPTIEGHLSQRVYPMIFTTAALWYRNMHRKDGSVPGRSGGGASVVIALALGWLFGIAIVADGFWRSMPVHDPWMTAVSALALWFMCAFGWVSLITAKLWLEDRTPVTRPIRNLLILGLPLALVLAFLTAAGAGSWALHDLEFGDDVPIATAELSGAELTDKPKDWLPYSEWVKEYRARYAARHGIRPDYDDWEESYRREFDTEVWTRWTALTDALDSPVLRGRDLRHANLSGAFLAGADLSCPARRARRQDERDIRCDYRQGADLRHANLRWAALQGARLTGADLSDAVARGALMQGADLTRAILDRAVLRSANLDGARLENAHLHGADLVGTQLAHADLAKARLAGASLRTANLEGANLSNARLTGAYLSRAILRTANLASARLNGAELAGTVLVGANLERARFNQADLERANLVGADCTRTDFTHARLHGANMLCRGRTLRQTSLVSAVGDRRTELPAGLWVWSCLPRVTEAEDAGDVPPNRITPMLGLEVRSIYCQPGVRPYPVGDRAAQWAFWTWYVTERGQPTPVRNTK